MPKTVLIVPSDQLKPPYGANSIHLNCPNVFFRSTVTVAVAPNFRDGPLSDQGIEALRAALMVVLVQSLTFVLMLLTAAVRKLESTPLVPSERTVFTSVRKTEGSKASIAFSTSFRTVGMISTSSTTVHVSVPLPTVNVNA